MKYLILIYGNPESREIWRGFSAEERAEGLAYYESFTEELARSGELVATEALAEPEQAKRIYVRDGATMTTDGPFAEVKEHLAGFYLIDVESQERAVEVAAKVPEASMGLVELRPIASLDDLM